MTHFAAPFRRETTGRSAYARRSDLSTKPHEMNITHIKMTRIYNVINFSK